MSYTGQDLKIKEKIDFKKLEKKKDNLQSVLPLHACSWLVSTFLISFTQVALTSGVGAYSKINTISHQAQNSYYTDSCMLKHSLRRIIQAGETKLPLHCFHEQKLVVASGTGWGRNCACATATPHLPNHPPLQWQLQWWCIQYPLWTLLRRDFFFPQKTLPLKCDLGSLFSPYISSSHSISDITEGKNPPDLLWGQTPAPPFFFLM